MPVTMAKGNKKLTQRGSLGDHIFGAAKNFAGLLHLMERQCIMLERTQPEPICYLSIALHGLKSVTSVFPYPAIELTNVYNLTGSMESEKQQP